jgi:CDGSH-type Zn-finger protein/uncharacterized Fe-S cluster protein YjdI
LELVDARSPVVPGEIVSGKRIRLYEGADITIRYDANRCIHAAECVHGLGRVFDPKARPWIDPDGASAEEIMDVVHRCPTGALSYETTGQVEYDPPPVPKPVEMSICTDGPIYVHGRFVLAAPDAESTDSEPRLALCRCGASDNKPYCDNSHSNVEFRDSGIFAKESSDAAGVDGSLTVTPLPNGPVLLRGPFVLTSADGACVFRGDKAALCRCGESENKPFCDGAHARIGFQSD